MSDSTKIGSGSPGRERSKAGGAESDGSGGTGAPDDTEETTASEQQAQHRAQASAYQGAMEAVFSVVIAVGAGYWADETFETSPLYLLIGAVIGFGAMVLRLVRMRPK